MVESDKNTPNERIFLASQLEAQLCQHGLAFQYSVIDAARDAFAKGSVASPWVFESAEHPVQLRGKPTHIDFLLRHTRHPIYLVCECKRVNPKFNTWYFLKAPFTNRDDVARGDLRLETLQKRKETGGFFAYPSSCRLGPTQDDSVFDIPIVAKTKERGDSSSPDTREVIDKAAAQVCLGMAGLFEQWGQRPIPGDDAFKLFLLPAIVTTARLFGCTTDLATTNLETGNITIMPESLVEKRWVFLQYPRSPGVCPNATPRSLRRTGFQRDNVLERPYIRLGAFREATFLRTIAIVSASSFVEFLNQFSEAFDFPEPLSILEPPEDGGV